MVKKKWIERIEIELGTLGTKSYHRFKGKVVTQKIAHMIAIILSWGPNMIAMVIKMRT